MVGRVRHRKKVFCSCKKVIPYPTIKASTSYECRCETEAGTKILTTDYLTVRQLRKRKRRR